MQQYATHFTGTLFPPAPAHLGLRGRAVLVRAAHVDAVVPPGTAVARVAVGGQHAPGGGRGWQGISHTRSFALYFIDTFVHCVALVGRHAPWGEWGCEPVCTYYMYHICTDMHTASGPGNVTLPHAAALPTPRSPLTQPRRAPDAPRGPSTSALHHS